MGRKGFQDIFLIIGLIVKTDCIAEGVNDKELVSS
jgi:hypothetical protein